MQEVKKIILIFFLLLFSQTAIAIEDKSYFDLFSVVDNVLNLNQDDNAHKSDILIDNFQQVINKTKQGNPLAAREDLKRISHFVKNDYQRLNFAKFLYSNGYFLLADVVLSEIKNKENFSDAIKMLRSAYGVKYVLTEEQEDILHKTMSLIYQENLPQEASFGLNKNDELMEKSDYANYVMACAFFELGQYDRSLHYINRAIFINSDNLSYKLYLTKVLIATEDAKGAAKLANKLISQNELLRLDFLKAYYGAKAKIEKKPEFKKYYQALISYLDNDFYGAIELVRAGLLIDDNNLKLNYLLFKSLLNISEVPVAQKIADKMHMQDNKSVYTQDAFGDLNFIAGNYVLANKHYFRASKLKSKEIYSKLILVNTILGDKNNVARFSNKLSRGIVCDLDYDYQIAIGILNNANSSKMDLKDENNYKNAKNNLKLYYLKNALFRNPCNSFYLLEMIDSARGNVVQNLNLLELATMLGDFNFYYYWKLGEFEDFIGNDIKAKEYYRKSALLNSKFEPAQKAVLGFDL